MVTGSHWPTEERRERTMKNYLLVAAVVFSGACLAYSAGLFRDPEVSAATQPAFPESGSTCFVYFDSMTVTGGAAATAMLGYPTEKAVLVSQYAMAHGDAEMLASAQRVLTKMDAGARLQIIAKTASSINGTILSGSNTGVSVFIRPDECHATAPISIDQETP